MYIFTRSCTYFSNLLNYRLVVISMQTESLVTERGICWDFIWRYGCENWLNSVYWLWFYDGQCDLAICVDLWNRKSPMDPIAAMWDHGAVVLNNPAISLFWRIKAKVVMMAAPRVLLSISCVLQWINSTSSNGCVCSVRYVVGVTAADELNFKNRRTFILAVLAHGIVQVSPILFHEPSGSSRPWENPIKQ